MKAGDILRHDGQADAWRGRYRLIEKVKGERNTWITETLADDDGIIDAIVAYYAEQEASGRPTYKPYDEQMMDELEWRAKFYGHRSKVTFVSAARYAEYF